MKIRKLLISTLGAGAILTTATPLITSCSGLQKEEKEVFQIDESKKQFNRQLSDGYIFEEKIDFNYKTSADEIKNVKASVISWGAEDKTESLINFVQCSSSYDETKFTVTVDYWVKKPADDFESQTTMFEIRFEDTNWYQSIKDFKIKLTK